MPQEFKVKNGLIVDQGGANITGSSAISGALSIASSGSSLFTVDGAAGRLFSVDDSLSGSLFSVNTIAGLPVMEAFSDNTVRIGQYGRRGLYVSQSSIGIGIENSLSASLHVVGSTSTSASNALVVDNSNLVDLLRISNNGQQFVTSPVITLTSSNAGYLISQSLVHSGSIPFTRLTGVNITPSFTNTTSSQTQTALRVSALFTGSASGSNTNNVIVDFGTQTSGSMFVIDDVVSGSIYAVNDFFGLPVLEVTSDAQVNMYDYPYAVFNKSASYVSLGLPSTFAVDSAVYLRADTVMDEGFGFTNRVSQGNGTTLNDSTASLYTYTFTTNTGSAYVNAVVTGYDSASRATISGEIKSTVKCLSGVASIIGNNFRYVNSENPGVNIDLTVSSNTFSIRAYGTGSRTYVWAATVTTQVI